MGHWVSALAVAQVVGSSSPSVTPCRRSMHAPLIRLVTGALRLQPTTRYVGTDRTVRLKPLATDDGDTDSGFL